MSTPAAPPPTSTPSSSSTSTSTSISTSISATSSASVTTKVVSTDELLNEFFNEVGQLERTAEVDRLLSAFKFDLFDILNLPPDATEQQVSKQYRSISLLVHPDKMEQAYREKAQTAFTILNQAKADYSDETKRGPIYDMYDQVRQKVITAAEKEYKRKRKREGAAAGPDTGPPDPTRDPAWPLFWRKEVKEAIIDREWKKRQLLKAAEKEDELSAKEKEAKAEKREEEEKKDKEWEEGREKRVSNWRYFQKGGSKKRARVDMKMPKGYREDAEHSYVRRAATTRELAEQQSDQ